MADSLDLLKDEVLDANLSLLREGLVRLTWGNVSGVERERGLVVIKPSGVPYERLVRDSMVVVDLEGRPVGGGLRPSSDTATHCALYRAFESVGGITHTHSPCATSLAQAGRELPCQGTTHADHFAGTVPLVRALTPEEVAEDYEGNTGKAIVECFRERGLSPEAVPGCLQHFHAPFAWGPSPRASVENAVALEVCSAMALQTWALDPGQPGLPGHLLAKHYERKHGTGAYYGQE